MGSGQFHAQHAFLQGLEGQLPRGGNVRHIQCNAGRADGQRAAVTDGEGQTGAFAPVHALHIEAGACLQGMAQQQHANKPVPEGKGKADGYKVIDPVAGGQGAQKRRQAREQQGKPAAGHALLPAGTGVEAMIWCRTCSGTMPFMRLSGVSSNRWVSTGSAMRRISSGNT